MAAWRSGGIYPRPPANLGRRGTKLWLSLCHQKPIDYCSASARLLLDRLVKTTLTVEQTHAELDRDPVGHDSSRLARQVATLNASISTLARQLRLSLMQEISPQSTGRLRQRGPGALAHHPLLGGVAVHGRPRR
jgi:hypothetical protein